MSDARFEDGREAPLRLLARDADDLTVISSLVQDAVLTGADLAWTPRQRRFSLLLNRYRWEHPALAERVRAVLDVSDVLTVRHQGLDRRDADTVLCLLSVQFDPDTPVEAGEPAGPGRITLVFSGDGAVELQVECIEVQLADVTRPYAAPARRAPTHKE